MASELAAAPYSAYNDKRRNPPLRSPALGVYRAHNFRISQRTCLKQDTVNIQGWPSRGGIIVLENATPPDFDFLHLDPLDPPLLRSTDQDAEDALCQGLLRLGATWWDSEARYRFIRKLEYADEEALDAVEADETRGPSRRERGWVRVAWPSHTPGALCVLACEKLIWGRAGDETLRPSHYGVVSLARTMDERFAVLQRLGGTVYAGIDEFEGSTFLKAWEEDYQGEKGPLVKVEYIEPSKYGGHPDDSLG
jgi:hypothetical protein